MSARLEVHTHNYVTGPNATACYANGFCTVVTHSHEGGDVPHSHPDMGPATYTICRKAWARQTGLEGGGTKKYTAKPGGPQFEYMQPTRDELEFEVIYDLESLAKYHARHPHSRGGGDLAEERMVQQFGLTPVVRIVE